MFKWFSCCATPDAASPEIESIEKALQPGAVAVISIACCMPGGAGDEAVLKVVSEGLAAADVAQAPILVSATEAQKFAMKMPGHLDASARRAIEQVMALFAQHGMSIFPVVLVDRHIAFYGGAPTAEQFSTRVRQLLDRKVVA